MLARLTARRSAPRAAVSKTAAQMPGVLFARRGSTHAQGLPLSPTVERLLRNSYNALDEAAPQMLRTLEESDAPLIWHKHSSFLDHLRGVWLMLVAWEQPQAVCRLGLFHSAYSNSFISMNLYDPTRDRAALTELIGAAAEGLVYIFCSIDRQQLEEMVLEEGVVRAEGYALRHIRTGESLHVSGAEAAAFVTETLADELEQRFGWQSDLEAGDVAAVWPGAFLPTLRMSRTNALALALRASGLVPPERLPPIFRRCSARLQPEDEEASRALYWAAVSAPPGREAGGGRAAGAARGGGAAQPLRGGAAPRACTAAAAAGAMGRGRGRRGVRRRTPRRVGHGVRQADAVERVAQLGPLPRTAGRAPRVADDARRPREPRRHAPTHALPRAEHKPSRGEYDGGCRGVDDCVQSNCPPLLCIRIYS